MATFLDNQNRKWTVEINLSTVRRVKTLTGVDILAETGSGKLFERLANDPIMLCDVLYAVVQPQCEKAAPVVTDEDFGAALSGDSIATATDALLQGIVDFFPSARRALLQKILTKSKELDSAMMRASEEKVDAAMAELMSRISGATSGSSPAS